MTILTWDLLLIPVVMGTATVLILTGLTRKDRAPEGTVVGILILAILAAAMALLVLVIIRMEVVLADLRATMETRMHLETAMPDTAGRELCWRTKKWEGTVTNLRGALLIVLFMSACAPVGPIQVVDPDISSLGVGYYNPRYIPNGCVYIIDKEEIRSC